MQIKLLFILFILLLLPFFCFAQGKKPNEFPLESNPGASWEDYTQAGGVNKKTTLAHKIKYLAPQIVPIASDPPAFGNTINLNKIGRVAGNGRVWFIDWDGAAILLLDGAENEVSEGAVDPAAIPGAGEPKIYQNTTTGHVFFYSPTGWQDFTDTYTAGSGISISGGIVSNTAPDQSRTITAGAGISVTGADPNFTVANTAPGIVYSGAAGIDVTGSTITNTSPDQVVTLLEGVGIQINGTYPVFTLTALSTSNVIIGPYVDDATAVLAGLSAGDQYNLTAQNPYGGKYLEIKIID